jgi:hypothetical protein
MSGHGVAFEDFLGSAGCQPATSGSLPDGTLGGPLDVIFETCLRQAAANYWLAACAPQQQQSAISQRVRLREHMLRLGRLVTIVFRQRRRTVREADSPMPDP